MLTLYLDESSSQNPKDVFAIGGFLSTRKKWKRFEGHWNKALRKARIQPKPPHKEPVFHMTDFDSREKVENEFSHIGKSEGIALQRRLLKVIGEHHIFGVAEAVPRLAYDDACKRYRVAWKPFRKNPTLLCLATCLANVERFRRKHFGDEKILCVFDTSDDAGAIAEFYNRNLPKWGGFADTITFSSRAELVPLQAADVLAYEAMKLAKNGIVGPTMRPTRTSVVHMAQSMSLRFGYNDEEFLERFFLTANWIAEEEAQKLAAGDARE